jgi:RNA polymerase sigma-70 factor (ECF subfamily)
MAWARRVIAAGAVDPDAAVPAETERAARFRALIDAELDRSYAVATLMLRDAVEAEDAVHDAALAAWRHIDELRDPERFGAWFGRIVATACRDRLRARRRRPVVDLGSGGATVSRDSERASPDATELVVAREALARALPTLDEDYRLVVALRYGADLTVPAIAERLGIAEGTVKSRLHHALRRLRAAIEPEEEAR